MASCNQKPLRERHLNILREFLSDKHGQELKITQIQAGCPSLTKTMTLQCLGYMTSTGEVEKLPSKHVYIVKKILS
jgi:hypothetical protein